MSSWREAMSAGLLAVAMTLASPAAAGDPLPPTMPTCQETVLDDPFFVTVSTPLGDIPMQLFPSVAPRTVVNFLRYIDRGDYEDTLVHRTEAEGDVQGNGQPLPQDFVIQAGGFAQSGTSFFPIETQDPILNEPCISNVQGTVAMARVGGEEHSATSQWFVNLNDNLGLDGVDGGFTVFGRVLDDGLDVATDIVQLLDEPPADPLPIYFTDARPQTWGIFRATPLLSPLSDPGVHGCFDVSNSGMLMVEDPQGPLDWEPGVLQDLPYAITSLACAGQGTGGTPSIPCSAPGRRVMQVDPNTGSLIPDPSGPFGFAEALLACDDIAASEAGFAARLDDLNTQLDSVLVKTQYTVVPEPGIALGGAAALLTVAALCRRGRA